MVDVIGRAKVIITGDVDSRSVDQAGGKIGRSLKAGALIGVASLGTVAVAGFKLYKGFEEGQAQGRKLAKVLENMGAGAATDDVEALATQISRLTGVNEDVIKQGQTLLGTFSEVAKSAGEQGGIFDRATRAAVDLAATGFGSVESSSIQLGKALQEPAKGVAALSRTGAFTKAQQEYVKALDKTGDRAGAQAYILKVLEDQVEGTAEESATSSQKIQNSLSEAGDAVGNLLDTLAGNKTKDAGDGKSLSAQIDDATDSINEFADSPGLKKFIENLEEFNQGDYVQGLKHTNEVMTENTGSAFLKMSEFLAGNTQAQKNWADGWGEISGIFGDLEKAWDEDWGRIKRGIDGIGDKISGFAKDAGDRVGDWRAAGRKLIKGFWDGLGSSVSNSVGDMIDGLKAKLNQSLGLPRTISIPLGPDVRIPAFAGGVRNFGGGLAEVGERGRELVYLPPGSDVYSNSESNRMLAGGAGSTVNNWNFFGPESLSQARRDNDWDQKYGTRFGAATQAAAL